VIKGKHERMIMLKRVSDKSQEQISLADKFFSKNWSYAFCSGFFEMQKGGNTVPPFCFRRYPNFLEI